MNFLRLLNKNFFMTMLLFSSSIFSMEQSQFSDVPKGAKIIKAPDYILTTVHPGNMPDLQELTNFKNAWEYVEKNILNNDNLIITKDDIIKINTLLTNETNRHNEINGGQGIRTQFSMVFKEDVGSNPFSLFKKYWNKNDFKVFKSLQEKAQIKYNGDLDKAFEADDISEEEKKCLNKVAFLPPAPSQIESLLTENLNTLNEMILTKQHPISIATYIHQRINYIHPFAFGNGRTARILMNTVLMWYGYSPIQCSPEHEYMKVVPNEITQNIDAMELYIAEKAKKQHTLITINSQQKKSALLICKVCSKTSTKCCGQCKIARYCSVDCQRKDWSIHKKMCNKQDQKNVVNSSKKRTLENNNN